MNKFSRLVLLLAIPIVSVVFLLIFLDGRLFAQYQPEPFASADVLVGGDWSIEGSGEWAAGGSSISNDPGSVHLTGGILRAALLHEGGSQSYRFDFRYMGYPIYFRVLTPSGAEVHMERSFDDPSHDAPFWCSAHSERDNLVNGKWYTCDLGVGLLSTEPTNYGYYILEFESQDTYIDLVYPPNKVIVDWGSDGDGNPITPGPDSTPVSVATMTPAPVPGIYYYESIFDEITPPGPYKKGGWFTSPRYDGLWTWTGGRGSSGYTIGLGYYITYTPPIPIYGYVLDGFCSVSGGCSLIKPFSSDSMNVTQPRRVCFLPQDTSASFDASLGCDYIRRHSNTTSVPEFTGYLPYLIEFGIGTRNHVYNITVTDFGIVTGVPLTWPTPEPPGDDLGYGLGCSITLTQTGTITGTATPTATNPITQTATISASLIVNGSFEDWISDGINPLPGAPWSGYWGGSLANWYLIGPASSAGSYAWRYAADGEYSLWRQGEGSANQEAGQICQGVSVPSYVRFLRAGFSLIPGEAGTGSRTVSLSGFGYEIIDYQLTHSGDPFMEQWVHVEQTIALYAHGGGSGSICVEISAGTASAYVDKVYAYALDDDQQLICPDPSDPDFQPPPVPTATPDYCGPRDPECTTPVPTSTPRSTSTPLPGPTPIPLEPPPVSGIPTLIPGFGLTPVATRCFGWEEQGIPTITQTMPGVYLCFEPTQYDFSNTPVNAVFGMNLTQIMSMIAISTIGFSIFMFVRQR